MHTSPATSISPLPLYYHLASYTSWPFLVQIALQYGGSQAVGTPNSNAARDFLQLFNKSEVVRRSFDELKSAVARGRPSVFVGDRPAPRRRASEDVSSLSSPADSK